MWEQRDMAKEGKKKKTEQGRRALTAPLDYTEPH